MFLYAAFNAPHLPNEAPEETIAQYAHIDDPNRRVHAAMVSELDAAIGQLLATLDEQGILGNTLVWFMSDNGGLNPAANSEAMVRWSRRIEDWFGRPLPFTLLEFIRTNALDGGSDNAPLRKGKQTVYEGGVRVPSAIYWKGQLPPGRSEQMVTVRDVLPTLLAAVDIRESALEFDGVNQWRHLVSGATVRPPDYLVSGTDGEALYQFPWKLLSLGSDEVQLYRIDDDPTESLDVSAEHPDIMARMNQALQDYPRGESLHVPLYRAMMDIDFFGGVEDRIPWSEIGVD
jgi:arylsulfatase A-like enzyme